MVIPPIPTLSLSSTNQGYKASLIPTDPSAKHTANQGYAMVYIVRIREAMAARLSTLGA